MSAWFSFCLLNLMGLFIWLPMSQCYWRHSGQPVPVWLAKAKHAKISIGAALALLLGGFELDTTELNPERKF